MSAATAAEGSPRTSPAANTLDRDFTELSASDLSKGELQFGLPAALIVLLLVVGTLVGVAIPMLMAIISIIVALGITAVVGQAFELNLFILNMIVAMGLALGIDYSLFIVARLREERHRGAGTREAILTVANTATRAVVFSGTAFALAMIAMLLVPDTTLRSLGLGAVIVGLVSIVVALTFHPAILMVLGDRVERLRVPWLGRRVAASAGEEGPLWRRAVLAVMRRPAISLIATTAVLLALAFPVLGLQLGAAGTSSLPNSSVAKQGLLALERDFPSGATEPVTVVFDGSPDDPVAQQGLVRLRAELAGDRDFAARALTVETGPEIGVASVPLTVEPSSARGSAAIDRLRDDYVPAAFGAAADRVFVGGTPAEAHDSFAVNRSWLPIVIGFVLTLSFVLLTLAFRSIAIPLTAIAVNLLSVGAAYGILVLVFQEGVGTDLLGFTQVERIDAWVPIFLFSVLFGLSMDYQVFLLSRIHERWAATGDTPGAIVHGVASTARLITGAAAIIIVVFAGFASGQLVAFQEMGFGIAIALALDATLVRLLLIPAAMRLLGERNWYLPALAVLAAQRAGRRTAARAAATGGAGPPVHRRRRADRDVTGSARPSRRDLQGKLTWPPLRPCRARSAPPPQNSTPLRPLASGGASPAGGGWRSGSPSRSPGTSAGRSADAWTPSTPRWSAARSPEPASAPSSGGPPRARSGARQPGSAPAPSATPSGWRPAPRWSATTPTSARSP